MPMHVAAHRADPAGDLAQRAGPVGQPDAQDDGVHHADIPERRYRVSVMPMPVLTTA